MMTKENAAKTDSNGIIRVLNVFWTRHSAVYQKGVAAPTRMPQVEGLKYPSGICKNAVLSSQQHSTIPLFVRNPRALREVLAGRCNREAPMFYAFGGDEGIGQLLDQRGLAAYQNYFETVIVVQVNM